MSKFNDDTINPNHISEGTGPLTTEEIASIRAELELDREAIEEVDREFGLMVMEDLAAWYEAVEGEPEDNPPPDGTEADGK